MTNVLIGHSPEDRETATYLARDLERQGVRASLQQPGDEPALRAAAAFIAVISDASGDLGGVWTETDRAARMGKRIFVVRLGEVSGDAFAAMPVQHWTDAFGPHAQDNVAHLVHALRIGLAPAASHPTWGDPASGHAPPAAPRGGLPAYRIVLGIAGVIGIAAGSFSLYKSGVFGGGSQSTSSNPLTTQEEMDILTNSSSPAAKSANVLPVQSPVPARLAGTPVAQIVARLQSRLPLRDGPVTLQSVTFSPNGDQLTMVGTTTLYLDPGPDWQRMNAALQTSVCDGPLGPFIPRTISVRTQMTDAGGEPGGMYINSCDRSTSGNPYYRNPAQGRASNSSQK